jgi:acetyl-CoA carboxylase biotin carboxyl carrier protein
MIDEPGPALDPALDAALDPAFDPTVDDPAVDDPAVDTRVLSDAGDSSLLGLIDRFAAMLERSDLTELEVEIGGTGLVLRKPAAIATPVVATAAAPATSGAEIAPSPGPHGPAAPAARPTVKAPLTGIWYGAPSPGSTPYVEVGDDVAIGQVIGLIEAMKLFNEIKSDLAGRVTRVIAEDGKLVKAKGSLIEVEPL